MSYNRLRDYSNKISQGNWGGSFKGLDNILPEISKITLKAVEVNDKRIRLKGEFEGREVTAGFDVDNLAHANVLESILKEAIGENIQTIVSEKRLQIIISEVSK